MTIRGINLLEVAKETFRQFRKDELTDRAAVVAYNILFSIVPLLIFLTALSGFVSRAIGTGDAVNRVTTWLFEKLPDSTATAVRDPIVNVLTQESGGLLSFGAILALWGGKNGVAAMMKGLNIAFDVEEARSWPKRNLVAIGLTIGLGLTIIVSSVVLILGLAVGREVERTLGMSDAWATIWSIARWPLILVVLLLGLAVLYWAGPNLDAPFRWLTPGAVLALVLWGVSTMGLSLYFSYAGSYAAAYGALGGVLAFVFWLYLVSLIILLGGELNAVLIKQAADANRVEAPAAEAADHEAAGRQRDAARA